jgi:hypothetical protein
MADAQLFGVVKAFATGVKPRIGIFERAMTGSVKEFEEETHTALVMRERTNDITPLLTGGVVLLDEIGDLEERLQAKLLRVLNGERQYRLGGEGQDDYGFIFRGVIILATWRDINDKVLRPDLRQRILHSIRVPSLSQYSAESRHMFLARVLENLRQVAREELEHLDACEPDSDSAPCPSREWRASLGKISRFTLDAKDARTLVAADWSQLGELRGMRAILRRMMNGHSVGEALASGQSYGVSEEVSGPPAEPIQAGTASHENADLDLLAKAIDEDKSLSHFWAALRRQWAKRVLDLFQHHDAMLETMIAGKGMNAEAIQRMKTQLKNLKRHGSQMASTDKNEVSEDQI